MGKTYDVEAYRKRIAKKKLKKQVFTAVLIVLMILAVGLLVKEWMDSDTASKEKMATFPINLKGETPISMNTTADSLVVTTEGALNFYSKLATKQNSIVHGFSKPITKSAGNYVLTYDHGGYLLRLDTKNDNSKTLKMKHTILFAEVQEDGMVAVAYQDKSYTSGVSVYNSNLDEPVCTYFMNEYIMALDFSGKDSCVIAAQTTDGSAFASVVYKLFFNREKEAFKKQYSSSMIVSISVKNDGKIALVCEKELLLLDREGKQTKKIPYTGTLSLLDQSQDHQILLGLTSASNPNVTDIVSIGLDGEQTEKTTTSKKAEHMIAKDKKIYILTKSDVVVYSSKMEKLQTIQNKEEYQYIAVLNGQVYGLSKDQLNVLT